MRALYWTIQSKSTLTNTINCKSSIEEIMLNYKDYEIKWCDVRIRANQSRRLHFCSIWSELYTCLNKLCEKKGIHSIFDWTDFWASQTLLRKPITFIIPAGRTKSFCTWFNFWKVHSKPYLCIPSWSALFEP